MQTNRFTWGSDFTFDTEKIMYRAQRHNKMWQQHSGDPTKRSSRQCTNAELELTRNTAKTPGWRLRIPTRSRLEIHSNERDASENRDSTSTAKEGNQIHEAKTKTRFSEDQLMHSRLNSLWTERLKRCNNANDLHPPPLWKYTAKLHHLYHVPSPIFPIEERYPSWAM